MSADERRAVIAAAAGPLFARNGYDGTRLDDVAAAAGVTKPIVYRHFADKQDLYLALLARHEADLPRFAAADPSVRGILAGWLTYVRANQHTWAMLFRDRSGGPQIEAVRAQVTVRAREVMLGIVTAFAGERIPSRQLAPTAELVLNALSGLALWWIDHPEAEQADLLDSAARLLEPLLEG